VVSINSFGSLQATQPQDFSKEMIYWVAWDEVRNKICL